jgi:hypothetical protein
MSLTKFFFAVCFIALLIIGSFAQSSGTDEKVLIRASKPYSGLVSAIQARGGRVTRQYNHIEGLAADVPRSALAGIRSLVGPDAISKDLLVPAPAPFDTLVRQTGLPRTGDEDRIQADSVRAIDAASLASFAAANPSAYLINNAMPMVGLTRMSWRTGSPASARDSRTLRWVSLSEAAPATLARASPVSPLCCARASPPRRLVRSAMPLLRTPIQPS